MRAEVLESGRASQWFVLMLAGLISLGHLTLAVAATHLSISARAEDVWMRMAIVEKPPPVEPPKPPDPPKPDPPKPKPKPVDFKDIPKEPPPEPPPEAKPVRRIVQGLSAASFAPGAGTGLQVRAGTTTSTKAGDTMSLEDADQYATVPYTSVQSPPKIRTNPPIVVPQEVIDAGVVGRVEVEVTVSPEGRVTEVIVVQHLQPAADAACVDHVKRNTRWTPYMVDGKPAAVTGVPFSCRFEKVED